MSENINYHRCGHSNYRRLADDLLQYGACEVYLVDATTENGERVARNTMSYFSPSVKKDVKEIQFNGYAIGGFARLVLVRDKDRVIMEMRNQADKTRLTVKEMRVGLRVKIHPKSPYAHQCRHEGTVTLKKDNGWWRVEFDNGYSDAYHPGDLYIPAIKNKDAVRLLRKD